MAGRLTSRGNMTTEILMPRFLYAMLKQLDLRSIDWNEVSREMNITNGHAARMRYSRFKLQIEGRSATPRKSKIRDPTAKAAREKKRAGNIAKKEEPGDKMSLKIKSENGLGLEGSSPEYAGTPLPALAGQLDQTDNTLISGRLGIDAGLENQASTDVFRASSSRIKSEPRDEDGIHSHQSSITVSSFPTHDDLLSQDHDTTSQSQRPSQDAEFELDEPLDLHSQHLSLITQTPSPSMGNYVTSQEGMISYPVANHSPIFTPEMLLGSPYGHTNGHTHAHSHNHGHSRALTHEQNRTLHSLLNEGQDFQDYVNMYDPSIGGSYGEAMVNGSRMNSSHPIMQQTLQDSVMKREQSWDDTYPHLC